MADTRDQEHLLVVGHEPGREHLMLAAIIILFVVVVFMVGLHLYARWYLVQLRRIQLDSRRRGQGRFSRSELVIYIDSHLHGGAASGDRGLDLAVLNSLPVLLYSPKTEEEEMPPLECAVCISEFEEKETTRLLPKCGHSFHIECVDMWFRSHSTCPICRSPVERVFCREPEPVAKPMESDGKANGPEPAACSVYGEVGPDCNTASLQERRKRPGVAGVRIEVPPERDELGNELTQISPAAPLVSVERILSMGRRSPATTVCGAGTSLGTTELDLESGLSKSTRCPCEVLTPS